MEDYNVPVIGEVLEYDKESLRAYWFEYASKPMLDDGEITWYKKKNGGFLQGVFDRLEEDLGINFTRVDKHRDAEIVNKRRSKWSDGSTTRTGNARWSPDERVWHLTTKRGIRHARSTMVHEIGHALGLTHPKNLYFTYDTIMSYGRDRSKYYFFERDIDELTGMYFQANI